MSKVPAISIDLGTINCKVGIFQNDKFKIIPNDLGEK